MPPACSTGRAPGRQPAWSSPHEQGVRPGRTPAHYRPRVYFLGLRTVRGAPALGRDGLARKDLTRPIRIAGLALKEIAGGANGPGLVGGELGLVYFARILDIAKRLGRRVGFREVRQLRAPLGKGECGPDTDERRRAGGASKRNETAAGTIAPPGLR